MNSDESGREREIAQVPDEAHENLSDHVWEYSKQDGIHRMKLHHPEGNGIVEVHSTCPKGLHAHLESVSIWMRSTPPVEESAAFVGDAPPPDDHHELLKANEGAVFTRLSPVQDGHGFCFSVRDVGSIYAPNSGHISRKYYRCLGKFSEADETLRVINTHGDMTAKFQEWIGGSWQDIVRKGKRISRKRVTYSPNRQMISVKSGIDGYWSMELDGVATETHYTLSAGWTESDEITKADWDAGRRGTA